MLVTRPTIKPRELEQVVTTVFDTMLGLEVFPAEAAEAPADDGLTGAIHLSGEWDGAILLHCSQQQACIFAGHFLCAACVDLAPDIVRDVLGEIVNMIGGNLKSGVYRGLHLSMPTVVNGTDFTVQVCRAEMQGRYRFTCECGDFWVTVLAVSETSDRFAGLRRA
jgi:CheY-specific phosphatase CheX